MFEIKYAYRYLFTIAIIGIASYFGNRIKQSFHSTDEEYEMIRKYLLNESPLYGYNKPKLWIHTKYEINSRKWKSFYSRNSTDLNQPYIHLTIKTIIDHCGEDFNICLIDDDTFSKILPNWDVNVSTLSDPIKSHMRELGMAEILYVYGGIIVPNSFVCLKNLIPMYSEGQPFVCENINTSPTAHEFMPDVRFMGAKKKDPTIKLYMEHLKQRNSNPHFTSEPDFLKDTTKWCLSAIKSNQMVMIKGDYIGVKSNAKRPILLEDLMEENYLDLNIGAYGIYIPADEVLARHKYQWFATMSSADLLKTNMIITKYLKSAIIEAVSEYRKPPEKRSVISI